MPKLTINDIAQLCGVGKSTVSRVLNNNPKVRPETRQKIEQIIKQYGFQPSKTAQALRGAKNRAIGIIVTRLSSSAENQALSSILPLLYAEKCEPIIVESQFNPQLVKEHLAFFRKRGVDGVILFAFSELEAKLLNSWEQKMVVIAKDYPKISSVCYDDYKAINILMQSLYQQGHRHIHYLGVKDCDQTTGYNRHQAYQQFCDTYQLVAQSIQGELNYEWAYHHVQTILSEQVSAIVCATDSQAIGVMRFLQEKQIHNIQVGSVGSHPLLHFLFPNVLTVDLGFINIGEIVVKQMLMLLQGQPVQKVVLDCQLVL